jgi:D-sedoheptulose 7-phosphate isomerase
MTESSKLEAHLEQSSSLLVRLGGQHGLAEIVEDSIVFLVDAIEKDKPILTCGNGGSASDALHVSGELVGRFHYDRRALNVVCLNSNVTVITAWANDVSYDSVFSRQVEAHGRAGGVLWGFSTSGNSENILRAFETAKESGMRTILMTGSDGGRIGPLADSLISVPGFDAPSAQNMHVVLYHFICAEVELRTRDPRS